VHARIQVAAGLLPPQQTNCQSFSARTPHLRWLQDSYHPIRPTVGVSVHESRIQVLQDSHSPLIDQLLEFQCTHPH
jgi:hypothetical protein